MKIQLKHMIVIAGLAWPGLAGAFSRGATGSSGQNGGSCNGCHSGGSTPTVKISGPATLAAGEQGTYTLVVSGGAAKVGGLDVSVDDPTAQLGGGSNTQVVNGE